MGSGEGPRHWRDHYQFRAKNGYWPPVPRLPPGLTVSRDNRDDGNLIVSVYNDAAGRSALARIAGRAEALGFVYRGTLGENLEAAGVENSRRVDNELQLRYALLKTLPGYEIATITELLSYECDNRAKGGPNSIIGIEPNFECRYALPGMIGSNYNLRSAQSKHDDYYQLLCVNDARNNKATGKDVKVAIVDSGYETAGVVTFRDIWNRTNRSASDKIGHGTAMTEIIRDLAPDAKLYSVRISEGTSPSLWNAMLGVSAASFEFDADIVNLSLGLSTSIICPHCSQGVSNCQNCGHDLPVISNTLESFLEGIVAVDAGTTGPPIVVSATGNQGRSSVDKPAHYGLSVAVGSVNWSTARSPFSNYGAAHSQFIVMPGGDEDAHQQPTEWVGEGSQGKCLGTSPATAYASGMLAVYLSDQDYCDPDRAIFINDVLNNCQLCSSHSASEHGKGYLPYIKKKP